MFVEYTLRYNGYINLYKLDKLHVSVYLKLVNTGMNVSISILFSIGNNLIDRQTLSTYWAVWVLFYVKTILNS